jgi:hypothetical protein
MKYFRYTPSISRKKRDSSLASIKKPFQCILYANVYILFFMLLLGAGCAKVVDETQMPISKPIMHIEKETLKDSVGIVDNLVLDQQDTIRESKVMMTTFIQVNY